MIDGEFYGPILFAFGAVIAGFGVLFVAVTQNKGFAVIVFIGIFVAISGLGLCAVSDFYCQYKKGKCKK